MSFSEVFKHSTMFNVGNFISLTDDAFLFQTDLENKCNDYPFLVLISTLNKTTIKKSPMKTELIVNF